MTIVDNVPACMVANAFTCFDMLICLNASETIKMGEKEKDPLKNIILENIASIEAYISTTEGM